MNLDLYYSYIQYMTVIDEQRKQDKIQILLISLFLNSLLSMNDELVQYKYP